MLGGTRLRYLSRIAAETERRRPAPTIAVIVIGLGLVLAPAIFQMFTRAPMGGEMMAEFRPLMTAERLGAFGAHLDQIEEVVDTVGPEDARAYPATSELVERWPAISQDMRGMLGTIVDNHDNFLAVDALPPFPLFPWFFVIPGLLAAGLGFAGLRKPAAKWPLRALVALGLGLIAAPMVFQMFSRAPLGAEMIGDFGPVMTAERIAASQQAFLVIGAAEGELRRSWIPAQEAAPGEVERFVAAWPGIAADMAPMIGAMADNLENFAAVAALPPFDLFPWFFVIPGVLIAVQAGSTLVRKKEPQMPQHARLGSSATRTLALIAVLALAAVSCQGAEEERANGTERPDDSALTGLLEIESGVCDDAGVTAGAWFRMVQPGGDPEEGPFVPNGDSPCGDNTWTPLVAGTDRGLRLGGYQPHPDPAFTDAGHGAASAILEPTPFFAVGFAVATNEVDPQTGTQLPPPSVEVNGGELNGNLAAFAVAWNGQHFNQGAPKPDGSLPGFTATPTGTFDAASGRFTLRWSSQIVGGPFDNFTGQWYLEGTLRS